MSGDSTKPPRPDDDLTDCDREPIHVPGSIQPHGLLLAVRESDWTVTHVSANVSRVTTAAPRAGATLDALLGPATAAAIRHGMQRTDANETPCHVDRVATASGEAFDVLAHRHAGALILELEPAAPSDADDDVWRPDRLAAEAARLERATSTEALCAESAAAIRRLTGFDKVMVYQFDEEWNGTVVAEENPHGMDPYLGLRFPASDIPAQARELYRRNLVRLVRDVSYDPVPLMALVAPPLGLPDLPLDLSHSVLRSVSPVHVEYLKNMGVAASMSVSIVLDGRLWGLVACHHRTRRFVPHQARSACAVLARLVAQMLSVDQARREAAYAAQVGAARARLEGHVTGRGGSLVDLADHGPDVLGLVGADGAAICADGECRLIGQTPGAGDVDALLFWLAARATPLFHSDRLSTEHPPADAYRERGAGVLALTVSEIRRQYVIWFRSEQIQSVRWAGSPSKATTVGDGGNLVAHPRKSFAAWTERVGRRSRPWRPAELDAAAALRDTLIEAALREAEAATAAAKDRFLAVLSHELRTPLNPVLTAASAMEGDDALPTHVRDMMGVIRRNVELETRLIDDLLDLTRIGNGKLVLHTAPVDLHQLIDRTLEVCERDLHEKGIRVTVRADAAASHVDGDPARLQQVLWNIVRNAIKFSSPGGRVSIRTANAGGARVLVEVADEGAGIDPQAMAGIFDAFEQGGRTVTSRYGGLGLGLAIARTLVELHRGRISAASGGKGQGAAFTVDLPTVAASARRTATTTLDAPATVADVRPTALRILLVEDHKDTARVMARLLGRLGYEIRVAHSVAEARTLVGRESFDLVVSDLSLPDGSGNDLMRELRADHGLRGIALTGYGMEDDVRQTREAGFTRHLTKPVDFQSLEVCIREVAAAGDERSDR